MFRLIDKVEETIRQNSMINRGDKIIVAVSGGPDSMCLLHLLFSLKYKYDIKLIAAHVNHGLRGEEADKDEDYVRQYCRSIDVPFYSIKVDLNKLAKEKKISCESAGREVRYNFFEDLMHKTNAQKIALAHNANDQAETVLMRLMRGTGVEGLTGIKPVRDNIFIRPIINISRDEIEEYCDKHKLSPRIDKTNLESIYTRNKIRLDLIPYIKENFNKDVIGAINNLVFMVTKDNEYLEIISKEKYKKYCSKKDLKVIINKDAFNEHEAILTRIIRLSLLELKGNLLDLEKVHIYDIINVQANETGKRIILPDQIIAYNNYGNIELYKQKDLTVLRNDDEYNLSLNDTAEISEMNLKVSTSILPKGSNINYKENEMIKYFDYDKVQEKMIIRFRRNGDKFTPFGMKGSKKLKDLFIDLKIPQEERDNIPLICFGDEIAWVIGYRISNKFKVDKNTNRILEIKLERRE